MRLDEFEPKRKLKDVEDALQRETEEVKGGRIGKFLVFLVAKYSHGVLHFFPPFLPLSRLIALRNCLASREPWPYLPSSTRPWWSGYMQESGLSPQEARPGPKDRAGKLT